MERTEMLYTINSQLEFRIKVTGTVWHLSKKGHGLGRWWDGVFFYPRIQKERSRETTQMGVEFERKLSDPIAALSALILVEFCPVEKEQ